MTKEYIAECTPKTSITGKTPNIPEGKITFPLTFPAEFVKDTEIIEESMPGTSKKGTI